MVLANLVDLQNILIPYPSTGFKKYFGGRDSYKEALEFIKQKINNDFKEKIHSISSINFYNIRNSNNDNVPEFVIWNDSSKNNKNDNLYIDYVIIDNPINQYPSLHYINQINDSINEKFADLNSNSIEILNKDDINFTDLINISDPRVFVAWIRYDRKNIFKKKNKKIYHNLTGAGMNSIPNPFKKNNIKRTRKKKINNKT